MGNGIAWIIIYLLIFIAYDLFMIVMLIISKAKKDREFNPLGVAFKSDSATGENFLNLVDWIALAIFIIFIYVRIMTYQCLHPIGWPAIKAMCCRGKPPLVPLVKHRELAKIAPKLFAVHSIMYFLIIMIGGAVA